jgi:hypothetical protein
VIALPHDDELCLRVMKEIEETIKFNAEPSIIK